MHLLIDLDHFLFPSETVLVLSAERSRGGRRRLWHQLSKHGGSCLQIQTQRKVYGARATDLEGNADSPSAFTSLIKQVISQKNPPISIEEREIHMP